LKEKDLSPVVSDEVTDKERSSEIKLYQCTDESGTLKITEVKTAPLYQTDLNSQVFSLFIYLDLFLYFYTFFLSLFVCA